MSEITLILLASGNSTRFGLDVKKQWLRINHKPLWQFVSENFNKNFNFYQTIIASSQDDIEFMKMYSSPNTTFVCGSSSRQKSLKNAIQKVTTPYVLVSDIARPCISKVLLMNIIKHKDNFDSVVPYLNSNDTVVYQDKTLVREDVKLVQTPQLSRTSILAKALNKDEEYTDESSSIVKIGGKRKFILGEEDAHKLTYIDDLKKIPCLTPPSSDTLSGNGFDVHEFDKSKKNLYLCGVKIESDFGYKAHSDGDVAIHSLIDAILGASGMGDIGMLFPDSHDKYKGIDSKELLKIVVSKITSFGYVIVNADITIATQFPKLQDYKLEMKEILSKILKCERVNIKATTTEKLGFIGRGEGTGVWANVNLKYLNWRQQL